MANIRGAGGLIGRNVVGTAKKYDGKVETVTDEHGKTSQVQKPPYYIVDAQLDMRDDRVKAAKDTNPHLESHSFKTPDGEERTAHGRPYTEGQFEKIKAAGQVRTLKDGTVEFAVKGDLLVKQPKEGQENKSSTLMINTAKPMDKSDFKLTAKTMAEQAKLTADMKTAVTAERAAEKTAQAQAGTPAPEAAQEAEMGS